MSDFELFDLEDEEETTTMAKGKRNNESAGFSVQRYVPEKQDYLAKPSISPWPDIFDLGEPFRDAMLVTTRGGTTHKIDYSEAGKGILKVWFVYPTTVRSILYVR